MKELLCAEEALKAFYALENQTRDLYQSFKKETLLDTVPVWPRPKPTP